MTWKKLTFLSFGLWALSVGVFLYLFIVGTGTKVDKPAPEIPTFTERA